MDGGWIFKQKEENRDKENTDQQIRPGPTVQEFVLQNEKKKRTIIRKSKIEKER